MIRQLHQSCRTAEGGEDLKKGTQLLEVYALEIQMCTEQKNSKRLKTLYEQSLRIKSAIPHPLIMGIVRGVGTSWGGGGAGWGGGGAGWGGAGWGEVGRVCLMERCVAVTVSVECGGKMHLREGEFSQAHTDFFEAFKNYDEAGSPR